MFRRSVLKTGLAAIGAVIVLIQHYHIQQLKTFISLNNVKKSGSQPFFGIWCGKVYWRQYISDEFFHLLADLEDIYGWKEVADVHSQNRRWLMNDTLTSYFHRYFNQIPDLILYFEAFDAINIHSSLSDWNKIRHPWLFIDDVHAFNSAASTMKKLALMKVENIIATYPYKIDEEYSGRTLAEVPQWHTFHRTWLPHSASVSFIVPYNRNPMMKIFLSGAINDIYPYRAMAFKMYNETTSVGLNRMIEYHPHPGYAAVTNATQSGTRDAYPKIINRYFAAITDTSIKNYIVAKIFEIPAAGALLLLNSEASPILARLGWFENVHYVTYNKTNMETIFSDVLSNRSFEKYERIRWTGHRAALEYHTTRNRSLFLQNLAMNHYTFG